jgi:hypothetical protein
VPALLHEQPIDGAAALALDREAVGDLLIDAGVRRAARRRGGLAFSGGGLRRRLAGAVGLVGARGLRGGGQREQGGQREGGDRVRPHHSPDGM